jgi:hypothetical protein
MDFWTRVKRNTSAFLKRMTNQKDHSGRMYLKFTADVLDELSVGDE